MYPISPNKQKILPLVLNQIFIQEQNSTAQSLLTLSESLILARYFLSDLMDISQVEFTNVVNNILQLAVKLTNNYVCKLNILEQKIKNSDVQQQSQAIFINGELDLLHQMGQTVSRLASFNFSIVDQNALFMLMQSRFIPIQKAAFQFAKAFYQNTVPILNVEGTDQCLDDDQDQESIIKRETQNMVREIQEKLAGSEDTKQQKLNQQDKEVLGEVLGQMKLPARFFLNKKIPIASIQGLESAPTIDDEVVDTQIVGAGYVEQSEQKEVEDEDAQEQDKSQGQIRWEAGQQYKQLPRQGVSKKAQPLKTQPFRNIKDDESETNSLSAQQFGYLLVWNSVLLKLSNGMSLARARENDTNAQKYIRVLQSLLSYLEQNQTIHQMMLLFMGPFLPQPQRKKDLKSINEKEVKNFNPAWTDIHSTKSIHYLCLHTLLRFANIFPQMTKKFYMRNVSKEQFQVISLLLTNVISPALLDIEINKLEFSQFDWKKDGMDISIIKNTREIKAHYNKDEIQANLLLKIPKDYPLKAIEVKLDNQVKVKQPIVRKWLLQISKILNHENGDILDAIMKWKSNLQSAFQGVDECPICYYIVHPSTRTLPKLPCRTCKNKFHGQCIRKWFRQSQKSKCPFCQNYFWS